MSDLFRSALGYLSSASSGSVGGQQGGQGGQGHHGGYTTASGGPSDETAAIGEVIAFSYNTEQKRNVRIVKLIAEGGFSFVFRAVDIQNGDSIAVKKILAPDAETLKAVEHEIEFMRQFQHEHIVKFYGSFMKSTGKNLQEHFIGMEYCPVPLPTPPFRLQHTTQTYAQTCKAIKYLHDFGIVHRDIKLENLLIGADGLVKLVDFGSATMEKIYPTADWSMAKRTLVEEQIAAKTTPMYRAPEMLDLWSNHPIDEHADLWALGCLLFALNFGQHPFQDSNKLAIVNANYSLPKNVSSSGPIVSLIKGLLQVNPADRFSFGQMFEILASIAESEGFSLNGQLPFKPASSPNITGGGGPGIVNPLGSAAAHPQLPGNIPTQLPQHSQQQQGGGSSGSLFSSLKGGAVSLLKNIKEQSQQYLAPPGPGGPPPEAGEGLSRVPPARPASGPSTVPPASRPLPPRPAPPSPMTQRREAAAAAAASHIEFENREYEAMQQKQHGRPQRPTPPKPPPPKLYQESQPQRVANLLDIGSEDVLGQRSSNDSSNTATNQPSSTADLLGDLFSSSVSTGIGNNFTPSSQTGSAGNEDLFWGSGASSSASNIGNGTSFTNGGFMNNGGMNLQGSNNQMNKTKNEISGDLLGDTTDPFASLLGKSLPNSMTSGQSSQQNPLDGFATFGSSQPFLQPLNPSAMPSSSSFQNLNTNGKDSSGGFGSGLLDTGSSRIPKNSSSPNLLSDLILDDIMGLGNLGMNNTNVGGSGSSVNKSNPSLNQSIPPNLPNSSANNRPNYNRNQIFDPPAGAQSDKKQTLDDVFGDILSSQGFGPGKADSSGKTINAMRKIEMLSNPNMDPTQIKVNEWREGKKKNIRALLSSLHTVTWDGCNWEETNMSQMITPAQVKKTYRKACLAIHPDKQMGQDWEDLAKLIFVELNEAWGAFEEAQQG